MPKIYIKSKDVAGASVVEYDGVCYTRTGNTFKASSVTLTPSPSVIQYFTDCDGCSTGQVTVPLGGTASVPNTATNFQFKFDGSAEGDTATIDLSGGSTCSVLLSVNNDNNLVFDAATPPTGNGPFVFTSVPQTISYVDCNTHTYDITLAALGSYVVTLARTGTGGILPSGSANTSTVTTNITGTELSALSASEQAALITQINTTITATASADIESVTTTLSAGSIIASSVVKFYNNIFITAREALRNKVEAGTLITLLTDDINNNSGFSATVKAGMINGMAMSIKWLNSGQTNNSIDATYQAVSEDPNVAYWPVSGMMVGQARIFNLPYQTVEDMVQGDGGTNAWTYLTANDRWIKIKSSGINICYGPIRVIGDGPDSNGTFTEAGDLTMIYPGYAACQSAGSSAPAPTPTPTAASGGSSAPAPTPTPTAASGGSSAPAPTPTPTPTGAGNNTFSLSFSAESGAYRITSTNVVNDHGVPSPVGNCGTNTGIQAGNSNYTTADGLYIYIRAGDTIAFDNNAHGGHPLELELTDGTFEQFASSQVDRVFSTPGNYTLRCQYHSSMTTTITVGSANDISYNGAC